MKDNLVSFTLAFLIIAFVSMMVFSNTNSDLAGRAAMKPSPDLTATGNLYVVSTPSAAQVYLGNAYKGTTPLNLKKIGVGYYNLTVNKSGYYKWSEIVQIKAGKTTYVNATLVVMPPQTGNLQLNSTPTGAWSYLDGNPMGLTPKFITGVASGQHQINFSLQGYYGSSQLVNVVAGQTTYVNAVLTPLPPATGSIQYNSSPSGALIYRNNFLTGSTPYTENNVPQGTHNIKIFKTGYYDWTQNINVVGGQTAYVNAVLVPLLPNGTIWVNSTPSDAEIHLDSIPTLIYTPASISATPLNHTVKLKKIGYYDWVQNVNVSSGQTTYVNAVLTPVQGQVNGSIFVNSTPMGAYAYVDNINRGLTPIMVSNLQSGNHFVKLVKQGYYDWNQTINVVAGQTSYINALLTQIIANCTDDDGGITFSVQGTTKGLISWFPYTYHEFTDTCQAYPYNDVLTENYCNYDRIYQVGQNCTYGCSNGRCLGDPNATLTLRINGLENPNPVNYNSIFNVSWTSTGTIWCSAWGAHTLLSGGGVWPDLTNLELSGNRMLIARHLYYNYTSPLTIGIQCGMPDQTSMSTYIDLTVIGP